MSHPSLHVLNKKTAGILLIAICIVLACFFSAARIFESYELPTFDWRCLLRGERSVSKDIVIIEIGDDTLKALGAWPIHREYHAYLIKILTDYGVKAIGFDVLFVEPSTSDPLVVEAAKASHNVYFVNAFFNPAMQGAYGFSEKNIGPLMSSYQEAARGIGHVNIKADRDGKRRRVFPVIMWNGRPYFHLAFRIAMDVLGVREGDVRILGHGSIHFSDRVKIPLDDENLFIVNYAGRWERTFTHYSYADILSSYAQTLSQEKPAIDLKQLKGKICLVGFTATASHDNNAVPIQSVFPMVGSHANILNNILQRDFIVRAGRGWNILILLLFGLTLGMVCGRFKPLTALLITSGLILVFVGLAIGLFILFGIWIDIFYPVVLYILIYIVMTFVRVLAEIKKRQLIENELRIAAQIQQSFLPKTTPADPELELAVYFKPAKAIGGDLYAFYEFESRKISVMLGDVSGKGTPAALFMAKAVSEFKIFASHQRNPSQVLQAFNQSIAHEDTRGLFVTLVYAIFDMLNKKIILSNGGHLPVLRARQDQKTVDSIVIEDGMPIGIDESGTFSEQELGLLPGDCFAFYSDGVIEGRDKQKREFGTEMLERLLNENKCLSSKAILDKIILELNQFMFRADQHDDITLIIAKIKLSGESS